MRWRIHLVILMSLLALGCCQVAGCTVTTTARAHVIVLAPDLSAPASTLPPLVDRSRGIELHSCADLIATLRAGKDLGELAESPRFNAYVDCMAVALVANGREPA